MVKAKQEARKQTELKMAHNPRNTSYKKQILGEARSIIEAAIKSNMPLFRKIAAGVIERLQTKKTQPLPALDPTKRTQLLQECEADLIKGVRAELESVYADLVLNLENSVPNHSIIEKFESQIEKIIDLYRIGGPLRLEKQKLDKYENHFKGLRLLSDFVDRKRMQQVADIIIPRYYQQKLQATAATTASNADRKALDEPEPLLATEPITFKPSLAPGVSWADASDTTADNNAAAGLAGKTVSAAQPVQAQHKDAEVKTTKEVPAVQQKSAFEMFVQSFESKKLMFAPLKKQATSVEGTVYDYEIVPGEKGQTDLQRAILANDLQSVERLLDDPSKMSARYEKVVSKPDRFMKIKISTHDLIRSPEMQQLINNKMRILIQATASAAMRSLAQSIVNCHEGADKKKLLDWAHEEDFHYRRAQQADANAADAGGDVAVNEDDAGQEHEAVQGVTQPLPTIHEAPMPVAAPINYKHKLKEEREAYADHILGSLEKQGHKNTKDALRAELLAISMKGYIAEDDYAPALDSFKIKADALLAQKRNEIAAQKLNDILKTQALKKSFKKWNTFSHSIGNKSEAEPTATSSATHNVSAAVLLAAATVQTQQHEVEVQASHGAAASVPATSKEEVEKLVAQVSSSAKGIKTQYLNNAQNLVNYYSHHGYNADKLLKSTNSEDVKAVKELTKMKDALKGKTKGISPSLKDSLNNLFNKAK
jgi:hypothetical protein